MPPRRAAPLLAVCSGYFLAILDATIVNAALPAIGRDLGAGVEGLQWVVEGYAVALAALLLSAGAIGDRVGARRAFAAGLVLFGVASAGCGAAPHVAALVAARAVQGAGAALMVPASLALLRAAYPTPEGRARAPAAGARCSPAPPCCPSWRWRRSARPSRAAALVAPLAATGLGMSITMPAATAATIEAAPAERAGLAAGVLNAARQAGGVVGVALLGALAGGTRTPATALLAAAAAFALGCAIAAGTDRRRG